MSPTQVSTVTDISEDCCVQHLFATPLKHLSLRQASRLNKRAIAVENRCLCRLGGSTRWLHVHSCKPSERNTRRVYQQKFQKEVQMKD